MVEMAAYLYPWDVVGDPAAPQRLAGLGLDHVVLAAVYHATRAVTPFHPGHRIVDIPRAATYYPPGDPEDSFGTATAALSTVDLPVHAWVVLNHTDPGSTEYCVVNAYGDRYRWALCPAHPEVVRRGARLAVEAATRPGLAGIELEACGWYGFEHTGPHDKTGGTAADPAGRRLYSICFCTACTGLYRAAGLDPDGLAARVRRAIDSEAPADLDAPADLEECEGVRQAIADRYRVAVVAAVRAAAPQLTIGVHAHPDPRESGSNTGVDPATAHSLVDSLIVDCWQGPELLRRTVEAGATNAAGSLLVVAGLGGHPETLAQQVAAVRSAGATGIRLYHAGLASATDLAAIRSLTKEAR
jgi:hypothetical protein